jgi:hypothetical protein
VLSGFFSSRLAALILFLLSLMCSLINYYEHASQGFPDGHLTELEVALRLPMQITLILQLLCTLTLLFSVLLSKEARPRFTLQLVLAGGVAVGTLFCQVVLPFYLHEFHRLDYGGGG